MQMLSQIVKVQPVITLCWDLTCNTFRQRCGIKLHRLERGNVILFHPIGLLHAFYFTKNFAGIYRATGSWLFVYGNMICMCVPCLFLFFPIYILFARNLPKNVPSFPQTAFLKKWLPQCSRDYCYAFNLSVGLYVKEQHGFFSPLLLKLDHIITEDPSGQSLK